MKIRAILAVLAVVWPLATLAQSYPTKPIHIVVPYPPGAGTDTLARIFGQKFSEDLRQPVIVDNRPGAGGIIGTEAVAKSPADGYTLLFTPSSHAINPAVYTKLPFDAERDFAPISVMVSLPVVLAVESSLPARDVKELVGLAKAKPGQLTIGSSGNGTAFHLTAEMFKRAAGIDVVHVAFKGGAAAIQAVLGRQVEMLFETSLTVNPHVKSGRFRALAVAGPKRSALIPDVPTLAEAGYPDVVSENWYGIYAPAGTSQEVVSRVYAVVARAIADPQVREKLSAQGADIRENTPQQTAAFVKAEMAKWATVAKQAGARAD